MCYILNHSIGKHFPSISSALKNKKQVFNSYHICNLIFFPSNSIVRILKSMPKKISKQVKSRKNDHLNQMSAKKSS